MIRAAAFLFFCLAASGALAAPPPMSVWYPFENPAAPGHSAGLVPWPAYPLGARVGPGRHGRGLVLDGTNGNGLYLPNPVSFFGEQAERGTIALWVKPGFAATEAQGPRVIFDFMRQTGNTMVDGYEIALFVDGAALHAKPCLDRQMTIDNPLRPDRWTHLALAWDCAEGTTLYVDGQQRAALPGRFSPIELEPGWPGRVGCHTPWGAFPFAGAIDELRLFNYRLDEAQVASLAASDPPALPVVAKRVTTDAVVVANTSREPVTVAVQHWLPGRRVPPPHRGYLPFPFGAVPPATSLWTAGAVPAETGPSRVLAAGEERRLTLPKVADYLGPRQVRVVVGEGWQAREIAAIAAAGLQVEAEGFAPRVVLTEQPMTLRLLVTNELGRRFAGVLRAELRDLNDRVQETRRLPLTVAARARRSLTIRFARPPAPGSYQVRLFAREGTREELLDVVALHATLPWTAKNTCDVAASYVTAPDDAALLQAMARDGVVALRLHGGSGDYYNTNRSLAALLRYGLKAWRMPAVSYGEVCAAPAKREQVRATARHLGLYLRDNPAVVNQVIGGEGLSCPPCYCPDCTESFRAHLRQSYGSLAALNRAWGSDYARWEAIQPLGSPRDIDETAERLKMMKVALELPSASTERWRRLFELDRPRAIEWKRWHEQKLIQWYRDFATAFHQTNRHRTPLSEQPCWPNFASHVLFALGRLADLGGMDLYLPGEGPTTLGHAAELFLNFDLNASIFLPQGKPLMVHELYLQDNSPARLPEAQGWWLVGRGYGLLSYFTYDYYYEGIRANQPLIFGLFDKQGQAYPTYPSFQRFSRDVKQFQARHRPQTLRREEPRVALFMGDDVSLANNLETGGATWEAAGVAGHNGAYWLTERSGYPVEFINDDCFARLAGKRALVVPWCHVIRPQSLEAILSFARAGGTVILDGAVGLYDGRYLPYRPLPGGKLAEALGIRFREYRDEPNRLVVREGVAIDTQGVPVEARVTRGHVLLRDAEGRPGLVRVPLGKGKVLFFLTNVGRRNVSRAPQPEALALWQSLLAREAGVVPRYRLVPREGTGVGLVGRFTAPDAEAPPLFDVSVRLRGPREAYVFLTSFFGPTAGTLALRLPPGGYTAHDALSGAAVPLRAADGEWHAAIDLPAYGSQVLHLRATSGRPFASW